MLGGLADLSVRGAEIDWAAVFPRPAPPKVALPTYPFRKVRYWAESPRPFTAAGSRPAAATEVAAIAPRDDLIYEVQWRSQAIEPSPGGDSSGDAWLVRPDRSGIAAALAARLSERGASVEFVEESDLTREDFEVGPNVRVVLDLGGLDGDATEPAELIEQSCRGALRLVQALARGRSPRPPRLWVATRGAVAVGATAIRPEQAAVWGLGRVAAVEQPRFWGGCVDLDPRADPETSAEALRTEIEAQAVEPEVAYRSGERSVPRLVRSGDLPAAAVPFRADATYLITGGLGALGLEVARALVGPRGGGTSCSLGGAIRATRPARRSPSWPKSRGSRSARWTWRGGVRSSRWSRRSAAICPP